MLYRHRLPLIAVSQPIQKGDDTMNKILQSIRTETRRALPAILYFFIAFNLFRITFGIMFANVGMKPATFLSTVIGAIVIGKIMIISNYLPFFNIFANRPLIYNTIWRTSIYLIFSFVLRLIDHLIPFVVKYKDIGLAWQDLLGHIWWARFWTIQVWYLILLLLFVATQELVKAIGAGRLRQIFFGR